MKYGRRSRVVNMKISLWEHQEEALEWLENRDFGALFMLPRSGKTAVAIHKMRRIYQKHGQILPTLILCPALVIDNWKREIEMHSGAEVIRNIVVLKGEVKKRAKEMILTPRNIFITNYEALDNSTFVLAVKKRGIRVLIPDESHRVRKHNGVRALALQGIADKAQYKIPLTGLPKPNTYLDTWGSLRLLGGGIVPENYYTFKNQFFEDKNLRIKLAKKRKEAWAMNVPYYPRWEIKAGKEKELKELIASCSFSVEKERLKLPPIVKQVYKVGLAPEQEKHYKQLLRDFLTIYDEGGRCVTQSVLTQALRLQQICSGTLPLTTEGRNVDIPTNKLSALKEIIEDIDGKFIIWSHWRESHKQIAELLDTLNISFVSITGATPQKERDGLIQAFSNDPSVRCYLGNQSAGGIGINLSVAQHMIYYSKSDSYEHDMQSEARFEHQLSPFKTLFRIDLVTEGTIEEDIQENLCRKGKEGEALIRFIARARSVLGKDSEAIPLAA